MFAAYKGHCHTCGRDGNYNPGIDMLPMGMKQYLQEGSRYLVIIDTGIDHGDYRYEWDVGHWIGGAFNQHIRGKVVQFSMMPLPKPPAQADGGES